MNFSKFFISRPIFAAVLSLLILIAGAISLFQLPISEYPEVVPPTVVVRANFPGANPKVIGETVASPLEQAITGVEGMLYMSSQATADGKLTLTITFALGTELDNAQVQVQNRVTRTEPKLPEEVTRIGITVDKASPDLTMVVHLTSPDQRYDMLYLSNYAVLNIKDELARLGGVGDVQLFGMGDYSLRVWLDPNKTASRNLTATDVVNAIREQNRQVAAGQLGSPPSPNATSFQMSINTQGRLVTEEEFENVVVRAGADGEITRLKDVARIELGSSQYALRSLLNNQPAVAIPIFQRPGSNAIDISNDVRARMAELKKSFPEGMDYSIVYDPTIFVRGSIEAVIHTLFEALILVVLVVILFLQTWRASIIPLVAVPVSLIGTFAVMHMFGFSLNALSLFGLVLAIGIVVDDAIVVVENIHRHLEAGQGMREAAIKGAGEIGFTVVSISFSLVAAFIPLLFMGGVVGRLFKEFALTATATILISVVVSLTLAPTLAALFMRAPTHNPHQKPGFGERLLASYERGLRKALAHQRLLLGVFGLTLALAVVGYILIPKGFFPVQDTAFALGTTEAAADISYPDMVEKHLQLAKIVGADPAVLAFSHSVGVSGSNQTIANGRFWISLKPRSERDVSVSEFIDRLRPKLAKVPGIVLYLRAGQDINLSSGPSRSQYQYVLKSNDGELLNTWTQRLTEKLRSNPAFRDMSNDLQLGGSVTHIDIDRSAAARFGLTTADVDQALYDAFGQRQISEYQTEVNQYKVILELDAQQRGKAESLAYFYLRSPLTNEMVPLSALAKVSAPRMGPLSISHDGMFPAANLSFNLASGVALGDAVSMLDQAKKEIGMPASIIGSFQGAAQAFQSSLANQPWLILAALVAVYIILGVLYESFVHPLTIISTLPSAGIGALLLLWMMGQDFSIMALIGIVLLIGIVKKNGILLVDFALQAQREQGLSPQEAIYEACITRFRPIIMTTLAALLGALPLMLGFGVGAELRQPLGIAVVGGLLVSQMLTLFTTPVIYLQLERLFHKRHPAPAAPALALHK
ncbi:RND efflux transporter [Pseudomonas amygdali pv. mori]|uniref:efflux RND transporter permease subunit n=1 Tax=Pseudomonas amygdali TaxID=47877 RepID=UPI000F3DAAB5|nr:efflux RND transporter permease subunit [Pseudomonas amygdali]RMR40487.1 RND efflux transporter [Pseudomonas amygdali pv. mori]